MSLCPVPFLNLQTNSSLDFMIQTLRSKDMDNWCISILTNIQRSITDRLEYYPFTNYNNFQQFWIFCYIFYAVFFYILAIYELIRFFYFKRNKFSLIIKSMTFIILGVAQIFTIYFWNSEISTVMIEYQN